MINDQYAPTSYIHSEKTYYVPQFICPAQVAIMIPIISGEAEPTVGGIGGILAKAAGFFLVVVLCHKFLLPVANNAKSSRDRPLLSKIPLLRSIGFNYFVRMNHGDLAILAALIWGLGVGLLAHLFGFHPAIGCYMAGLILDEEYLGGNKGL